MQNNNKMKSKYWMAAAALLVFGCSQKIFFDTSVSANFAAYKRTFAFLPPIDSGKTSLFENGIMNENIRVAILSEMKRRNYTADTVAPELLVKFHLMVENKEDVVNSPVYSYGGGYGYNGGYGYGGGFGMFGNPYYNFAGPIYMGDDIEKVDYEQGTLVIDVIERSSGKLVWRGWSVGDVNNAEQYTHELPNLIDRIFNHYPIKVKS